MLPVLVPCLYPSFPKHSEGAAGEEMLDALLGDVHVTAECKNREMENDTESMEMEHV